MKKYLRENRGAIIALIIIVLLGIVLLNFMLQVRIFIPAAQNNDWIGFWGSLSGAIVSGVITFFALHITFVKEEERRKEDIQRIQSEFEEKQRISIMPYISYQPIADIPKYALKMHTPIATYITGKRSIEEINHLKQIRVKLALQNVGLGPAINPSIVKIKFGKEKLKHPKYINHVALNNNLKIYLDFLVGMSKDYEDEKLELIIGYHDLFQNYYEQSLHVTFDIIPIFTQNGGMIDYNFEPKIENITKAKIAQERPDEGLQIKIRV